MFGWCPDAADWRMYKLNRLTLLSVTAQTFEPRAIPPEALDFNARFHDGTLLRARVAASECYRLVEEYGPACYTHQPDGTARAAGAHGVRGAGSVRGIWRAKKIKTQGHDTQMSCPCVYNQCKGGEPP